MNSTESRVQARRDGPATWACLASAPILVLLITAFIRIGTFPIHHVVGGVLAVFLTSWALLGLGASSIRYIRTLLALPLSAVLLTIAAEVGSFYVQGKGFTDEFFIHALLPGGHRGLHAYPDALIFLVSMLVLALLIHLAATYIFLPMRQEKKASRIRLMAPILLLGLALSPVPRLVYGYLVFKNPTTERSPLSEQLYKPLISKDGLVTTPGKNLVIIYLESFDSIYLDDGVFPGLAPNIRNYALNHMSFTGMRDYPGIGYTMAGIFSSQCGAPFSIRRGAHVMEADNAISGSLYMPHLVCLGDVLKAAGYKQTFMGGADSKFAGKERFFELHGYDEIYGLADWQRLGAAAGNTNHWGLFDGKLLELAAEKFEELSASNEPFNLTILTLDTHGPEGITSPSCTPYQHSKNSILQAVHCTDQLVDGFLRKISQNPKYGETAVILMGDHASMQNEAHALYPETYVRAPILAAINVGKDENTADVYHMDVAPTILSLMDVRSNAEFLVGWAQDNSGTRRGLTLESSPGEFATIVDILHGSLPDIELCRDNVLVRWSKDGKIGFGDYYVTLRDKGYPVESIPDGASATARISKGVVTYAVMPPGSAAPVAKDDEILLDIRNNGSGDGVYTNYTIIAHNEHGGTAVLADSIRSLKSISLQSDRCSQIERELRELDTEADYLPDIKPIIEISEIPVGVDAYLISEDTPTEWLMSGWSRPTSGGVWGVGDVSRLMFSIPSDLCRSARVEFRITPYLSESRPKLRVSAGPENHPERAASTEFTYPSSTGSTLSIDAARVSDDSGECVMSFVFLSERQIDPSKPETPTDAWPITFSLQSIRVH